MLTGIAAYAGYRRPPTPGRVPLALSMLNPAWALTYRERNPGGYLILRPDRGDDPDQIDYSADDPQAEAQRFFSRFILPALRQVPAGTYSASLGANEQWPGADRLDFRAAFELALCRIVQGVRGLDYVALACPVGNLKAVEVDHFAGVFREARWISYHAYLRPNAWSLSAEIDGDYFWRPTRAWMPQLRRLGLPLRLLCTESGTFARGQSMTATALAELDVALAGAMAIECARVGATFGGMLPFGFGLEGGMAAWNLDGNESLFESGGGPVADPVVGPGIAAKLAQNQDHAITAEQYITPDWSVAVGGKGIYIYSRAQNDVAFLPPTGPASNTAILALADNLIAAAQALKLAAGG